MLLVESKLVIQVSDLTLYSVCGVLSIAVCNRYDPQCTIVVPEIVRTHVLPSMRLLFCGGILSTS